MNLYLEIDPGLTLPATWQSTADAILALYEESEQMPAQAEVGLTIVDNDTIQTLNREHRGIDKPTDVLSFPLYDAEEDAIGDAPILLGDVVISLPRAMEQAEDYGHSLERELSFLWVHGLLHLAGFDHMEEDERAVMREHEEALLNKAGIPR